MRSQTSREPSAAGELARSLLAAWNSRDHIKLKDDLGRVLSSIHDVESTAELNRLDLLLDVAERIQNCSDRFARPGENPDLDEWLGLLRHLADYSF